MLLVRHRQILHRMLRLQERRGSGEFQAPPGRPQGIAMRQSGAQVMNV